MGTWALQVSLSQSSVGDSNRAVTCQTWNTLKQKRDMLCEEKQETIVIIASVKLDLSLAWRLFTGWAPIASLNMESCKMASLIVDLCSQFPDPWFNFTLTNINFHITYKFIIFIMSVTIPKNDTFAWFTGPWEYRRKLGPWDHKNQELGNIEPFVMVLLYSMLIWGTGPGGKGSTQHLSLFRSFVLS